MCPTVTTLVEILVHLHDERGFIPSTVVSYQMFLGGRYNFSHGECPLRTASHYLSPLWEYGSDSYNIIALHPCLILQPCRNQAERTFLTLRLAPSLERLLGEIGINIMTRIMGLITASIAVEFIVKGIKHFFPG